MKKSKKQLVHPCFTLIETLIAITFITVVISAVTGLILSTLIANQRNTHMLQGLYLAEEGLEAVRFMRDSNWLQNYSWDDGTLWGSDFSTGSQHYLKEETCPPCFSFSSNAEDGIVETEDGFSFVREVSFATIPDENDGGAVRADTLEVTVTVSWADKLIERSVDLSTYLTNWK